MPLITFTWIALDGQSLQVDMHVDDLTDCAPAHKGQNDFLMYHIMPEESIPPALQWLAMVQADLDPVGFWQQVSTKQHAFTLPAQLLDPHASWIGQYQIWAGVDLAAVGKSRPVCRTTVVSIDPHDRQATVKPVTLNHA